jgi:glycine cleavage system H lipoate-binding protein
MTENYASDLLSRLRADREGILAARDSEVEGKPRASKGRKREKEAVDVDACADATEGAELKSVDAAAGLFADEEMEVIRAMRAKVDRVDARLTSLQEWVAETRSWTERVELAQKAQLELGRLVLVSQERIDQQVRDAEERAARIVAEAEEQARALLAAAEVAAAEVAAAATRRPAEESPAAEPEPRSKSRELSAEEAEAEELYEAIELFTRTNAELVNELSALISTIPAREQRH